MPETTATKRGADKNKKDADEISGKLVTWTKIVGVFTALLFLATLCIFAATGFTAYFIWGQWQAAIDAQSDVRKQINAFVTFSKITQITPNDQAGKILGYLFVVQYINFGATRTKQFHGWASVKYFEKEVPYSQDFSKPFQVVTEHDLIIGPNSPIDFTPITVSPDEAIKAKNKQGVVVIWGRAEWSGLYDGDQMFPISFCYNLVPTSSEGDERIFFTTTPLRAECNTGMKKISG